MKIVHTSTGKVLERLSESKSVECIERNTRNLGDPLFSFLFFLRVKGSCYQLYGEAAMVGWKSDDFIVL